MIEEGSQNPDGRTRRQLLGCLARAFRDNPMNVEIHGPNPARRVRANRAGLKSLILDSEEPIIVRGISHELSLVGGFALCPPEVRFLPSPDLSRQVDCLFAQGVRAMDQWGQVNSQLGEFRPWVPHWYLAVLGIDLDFQGQGIGRRLLAELDALVEARGGGPVYLESDRPESVAFYVGQGFEIRHEALVHGVPCWCLGRGFDDEIPVLCDPVREA